ncbi:ribbon-helix-helix protein, CopG family [Candidatus Pacearchaeota archaeon]|nr:ribbon-helix-helix protein, CopG family [Candidatus Pacearchaeota archaeon]
MSKKRVTIEIDDKIIAKLQKRARKNMMSLRELIQDIVRRSAVSSKFASISGEADDRLIDVFSRKTKKRMK